MKQKLHVSWHIAALAVGLLAGTGLALLPQTRLFASATWLVTASSLLFIVAVKRYTWMLVLAAVAGMLIGLWRGAGEQIQLARYQYYYGQSVMLKGHVSEDVTVTSSGQQQVKLDNIRIDDQQLKGSVWLSTSSNLEVLRGDYVTVEGNLDEGFGNIAASMFRADITSAYRPEPGDIGRRVRDWFATQVRRAIPEPQASLGISYVAGQRKALPENLSDELRLLGLIHLVVASGFHLTLVVRFIRKPLSGVSKYLATAGSLALISGFLLISGFSTSMIRASLVTGLSLLAWYYGRRVRPVVLLAFVAALTVLLDPSFLWGDVGWYLSFAAFGGVIILAPLLHKYFWGDKEPGFFRHLVVASIAAQASTFPIIAFTFGQYSPLALLANLMIQPLVSVVVMLLTFVGGLAGALLPGLATWIGWPAQTILSYMTSVTSGLSARPEAAAEVDIGLPVLLSSYLGLLVFGFFLWRRTRQVRSPEDVVI